MRPSTGGALLGLVVLLLAGGLVLVGDHRFPLPRALPGPPQDARQVVVAMGDSSISGEGAGDYEAGTDGEDGNWCHRSPNASIHELAMPTIDRAINLACSGAPSPQVGLGDVEQYTEPSQAQRLARIATTDRVVAVVVASGANDEPAFSHVLDDCVQAWISNTRSCAANVGKDWQRRVNAMVPKLIRALTDIRTVMRNAGYRSTDYELVVQSYAAPISPKIATGLQDLSGCPIRSEDLRWVRDKAVPVLTEGVRAAAAKAGVRFLDLSAAGIGHEACSNPDPRKEWFSRLTVRWTDLEKDDRATHALQASFHPNALGHKEFGACLGEFLNTEDQAAKCLAGPDGNLHAAATVGPT